MKVLVTGADGYIGSLLAPLLLEAGHDVVGLDTGFFRAGWLYRPETRRLPAVIDEDLRRVPTEALRGFDAVVHLAELSNDPLGELRPEVTEEINHRGSSGFAERCKAAGVERFVYSSSCSVYGVGTDALTTEASTPNPQTAYARCKVRVEGQLAELADDRFSPTCLRNATVFGAAPRMRFDLVLNNLAGLAWTTGKIQMTSDGTPWRPLVHVRDVCSAFQCALEAPREAVHGQTLNVGDTAQNYRVREIAELVAAAFPGTEVRIGSEGADNRSYRVGFEAIRSALPEFRCRIPAAEGAEELRRLFEHVGLSRELFESRNHTRLRQLQHLLDTGQLDERLFWTSMSGAAAGARAVGAPR